jgi:hypothetical protein
MAPSTKKTASVKKTTTKKAPSPSLSKKKAETRTTSASRSRTTVVDAHNEDDTHAGNVLDLDSDEVMEIDDDLDAMEIDDEAELGTSI